MNTKKYAWSRRDFMKSSLAVTASASSIPSFLTNTCLAAPHYGSTSSLPGITEDTILVVVQLSGGNDGLNTLIPHQQDAYYRARPTISLKEKNLLKANDQIGFHPALKELQKAYDEGEVAWIQGVGYPNPNRSHFRSMDIWHSASDADKKRHDGWLGRYFDNCCGGTDPLPPTIAVTIGKEMPLSLRRPGGHATGIVLKNAEFYAWQPTGRTSSQSKRQADIYLQNTGSMMNMMSNDSDYLQRTALDAYASPDIIEKANKSYRPNAQYPNHTLGRDLQLIAKLISGKVGGRVYYASMGGFDTHAKQGPAQHRLLSYLSTGLDAFKTDLKRKKLWDKVVVLGFSEFGRRVAENNSAGTDHGAAAPMFIMGPSIKGGIHGTLPSLTDLHHGDLKHHTDFRSVYATLLDQWMGVPHASVLGRSFDTLDLIRS